MVDVGDDGDVAKGAGHRNLETDGTRKRARTVLLDARAICSLESVKL
ncbi:pyridoxal-dependent decarboxylase [Burkholderia thailandensis]|nr:pyridoxal-dependent decarboxylase [Burkholderia thailandensis]